MARQHDTAAVIPCLNEEAAVRSLVPLVRNQVAAVCVVDDGSSDQTSATAEALGAHVIRHATPQGKGVALRAGWHWARMQGYAWALTLDGDGQHSPADIPSFLRGAEHTGAPLVIGNRMGAAQDMPLLRKLVNRWMSRRLSELVSLELPDSQCGYRLINLEALSTVPLHTTHFEIESEVLVGFLRSGYGVSFVPITVIYGSERSKIRPLRDAWRWIQWWRRARVSEQKGKYVAEIGAQPSIADA